MSAKTNIIVLRKKEIIYTVIFAALAILLVLFLYKMFRKDASAATSAAAVETVADSIYTPGIYTSTITLGTQNISLEVTVDTDHINSIRFVNLDESITTMYPLMNTVLDELSSQIITNQSTQNITWSEDKQYTSQLLLNAIEETLDKAKVSGEVSTEVSTEAS